MDTWGIRVVRHGMAGVLAALVLLSATACAGAAPPASVVDATPTPVMTQETSPVVTQETAAPTASEPVALVEDVAVELTDHGIADIKFGDPDAIARLTTLLGEPDGPPLPSCSLGGDDPVMVTWAGLRAEVREGTLEGWSLIEPTPDVLAPFGIEPGDTLDAAIALGAVPSPLVLGEADFGYETTLGGYGWRTDTGDGSAIILLVGAGGGLGVCE